MNKFYFCLVIFILALYGCIPQSQKDSYGKGPDIRVMLATIEHRDSILFKGPYILYSEEARYELGDRNDMLNIVPLNNGLQLFNQNRNLLYKQHFPIVLKPKEKTSHFIYAGKEYSGSVIFQPQSDSTIYLVNKLPLEEYLRGVVPAEINSIKQEYFEAVKAQAICARTYAYKKIKQNSENYFDVYSTVADQVYDGFDRHTVLADKAIDDTKNVLLTFNGEPAVVYYHSTCGGQLEAVENVFQNLSKPYLKGGKDVVGDIYSCSASPYFRWIEKRRFTQLDSSFKNYYDKSLLEKEVKDTTQINLQMQVLKRNSTGRIEELQISYADTNVNLTAFDIRRFFAWPPGNYLQSNLFYFTQTNDSTVELNGAGYGHGVGMCQWGAMNMSQRGFHYYHILGKYFPGTKLSRNF